MSMCKKNDMSSHENSIKSHFLFLLQSSGFMFRHLTLVKMFITEYLPDVRTVISQT